MGVLPGAIANHLSCMAVQVAQQTVARLQQDIDVLKTSLQTWTAQAKQHEARDICSRVWHGCFSDMQNVQSCNRYNLTMNKGLYSIVHIDLIRSAGCPVVSSTMPTGSAALQCRGMSSCMRRHWRQQLTEPTLQ